MIGEAKSVTDLQIPAAQQRLAEAVAKVGRPTVVLLKNGRALELGGAVLQADAIMVTWFLGMLGHRFGFPSSWPQSGVWSRLKQK